MPEDKDNSPYFLQKVPYLHPDAEDVIEAAIELADTIDPKVGKHLDGPPTADALGNLDPEECFEWLSGVIDACQVAAEIKNEEIERLKKEAESK